MRKHINYIFSLIAGLALVSGCVADIQQNSANREGEGSKVKLTFVPNFSMSEDPATRAFSTLPDVRNIYVAVFDAAGYKLSEYAEAIPNTYADKNWDPADPTENIFAYSVELTVTDQPRILHIIANAPTNIPYGSEAEVIGSLTTPFNESTWDGSDAYWARVVLEDGVWAYPDPETAATDANYTEKYNNYKAVVDKLSEAKLIRNFCKITLVESATDFELTRFWLTNIPDRGSFAPYNRNTGKFQIDYSTYTNVDNLRGTDSDQGNYQGFLPVTANILSLSGKSTTWLDDHQIDGSSAEPWTAFCYEREIPNSDPLYVIIGGKWDGGAESFYKIDLRDDNGDYFPILRNFNYKVNIKEVLRNGSSSVEEALSRAPSGEVSTSIELGHVVNISNGVSQLAVSEVDRVIVGSLTSDTPEIKLTYKFVPDIVSHPSTVCNTVLESGSSEETAAIEAHEDYVTIVSKNPNTVFSSWSVDDAHTDSEGYSTITLQPKRASEYVKTEVFTITGHHYADGKYEEIQREITYRLREKLQMSLVISSSIFPAGADQPIDVTIGLEANLPSSVFTLDFTLESEHLYLTTNNDPLPVLTGQSLIPGSTHKSAFMFSKAITWDDYQNAETVTVDLGGGLTKQYKYFTCHFKTNQALVGGNTDNIYATNPYFEQAHVSYTIYDGIDFTSSSLSPAHLEIGTLARLAFDMPSLPADGKLLIGLKGLEPYSCYGNSEERLTYKFAYTDGFEVYELDLNGNTAFSGGTTAGDGTDTFTGTLGIGLSPYQVGTCTARIYAEGFVPMDASVTATAPDGIVMTSSGLSASDSFVNTDGHSPYIGQSFNVDMVLEMNSTTTPSVSTVKVFGATVTPTTRTVTNLGGGAYRVTLKIPTSYATATADLDIPVEITLSNFNGASLTKEYEFTADIWNRTVTSWSVSTSSLSGTTAITNAGYVVIRNRNYGSYCLSESGGSLNASSLASGGNPSSSQVWTVSSGYQFKNAHTGTSLHLESNTFSLGTASNLSLYDRGSNRYNIYSGSNYLYQSGNTTVDRRTNNNNNAQWLFYTATPTYSYSAP